MQFQTEEEKKKKVLKPVNPGAGVASGSAPQANNGIKHTVGSTNSAITGGNITSALTGKQSSIKPINPAVEDKPMGSSAAAQPNEQWNKNANFGVRDSLEKSFGVDGGRLSYDGENVTYDGKALLKPDRISDEGRSYVEDEANVRDALSYYAQKNGMVGLRDYATAKGTHINVGWDSGTGMASINGVSIKPDFIVDGKAYVYQSKLDEVLTQADNGLKRDTDILQSAYKTYGDDVNSAAERLKGYDKFSYHQDEDVAYQNFMDMYKRVVGEEYANNVSQAKFRTGGVYSPGAMETAGVIRANALKDAATYAQQYEDRAYGRWADERGFAKEDLAAALELLQNNYGLESGANAQDVTNYRAGIADDWERRFFLQQLLSGNLDLGDREVYSNLYRRDAKGYADNEKIRDNIATDDAVRTNAIGNQYDWKRAAAEVLNLDLSNEYLGEQINGYQANIANDASKTALAWQKYYTDQNNQNTANAQKNREYMLDILKLAGSIYGDATNNATDLPSWYYDLLGMAGVK